MYCGTINDITELKSRLQNDEEITYVEHPFGNDDYLVVPYVVSGIKGAYYLIDPQKCKKDMVLSGGTVQYEVNYKPKSLPGSHTQSIYILGGQYER